jgi:hypothetical protein
VKKLKYYHRTLLLLGGVLVATTAVESKAQTADLTVQNYSSLDLVQVGGTVNGTPMENAYIGIYTFGVSQVQGISGLANGSTVSSICFGPLGNLTAGTYQYSLQSFAQASPGLNPSTWAQGSGSSAGQLWGIQNANYLWSQYGAGLSQSTASLTTATASAALALAIYDALYNSTGYGATPLTGTGFAPNLISTLEATDYAADIANLDGASSTIAGSLSPGYIFVPTLTAAGGPSGQSFIVPDLISPVPEPTTIVAASMLLFPLGASALRAVRKKQARITA